MSTSASDWITAFLFFISGFILFQTMNIPSKMPSITALMKDKAPAHFKCVFPLCQTISTLVELCNATFGKLNGGKAVIFLELSHLVFCTKLQHLIAEQCLSTFFH